MSPEKKQDKNKRLNNISFFRKITFYKKYYELPLAKIEIWSYN